MSDAYLNLINAAKYVLGCRGPGVTADDEARAQIQLAKAITAAEKEIEPWQMEEINGDKGC